MSTNIPPVLWWKGENNPLEYKAGVDAVWNTNTTPLYYSGIIGDAFGIKYPTALFDDYRITVPYNALFNFAQREIFLYDTGLNLIIMPLVYGQDYLQKASMKIVRSIGVCTFLMVVL